MEVPRLVKDSVVTHLYDTRGHVEVADVFVCRRVPKKKAGKVVTVQFRTAASSPADADLRAEELQVAEVGLGAEPCLEGGSGSDAGVRAGCG